MASQEEFDKRLAEITEGMPDGTQRLTAESIMVSELYCSYLEAKFSPAQALYLTAAMVTGNPGTPPSS